VIIEKSDKNLMKSLDEVMHNDIKGILRKRKMCGKLYHSGNPLSETVNGQTL